MSITIDQLAAIIDHNFGPPFLQKGQVTAEIFVDDDGTRSLSITIGRRDVQIDEDGNILGAGTMLV